MCGAISMSSSVYSPYPLSIFCGTVDPLSVNHDKFFIYKELFDLWVWNVLQIFFPKPFLFNLFTWLSFFPLCGPAPGLHPHPFPGCSFHPFPASSFTPGHQHTPHCELFGGGVRDVLLFVFSAPNTVAKSCETFDMLIIWTFMLWYPKLKIVITSYLC